MIDLPPSPRERPDPTIRIGALAPLTQPGWVEAGEHLLAGLEIGVRDVNAAGGIHGTRIELLVRDTAADPRKAAAAVDELAGLGAVALAGEYHSVVARAVAQRADALEIPYLCSSAVLDAIVEAPSKWVARLSPPQSRGWRVFADHLLDAGHRSVALATQPSIYWAAGTSILRDVLEPRGCSVTEHDLGDTTVDDLRDALVADRATALLLLLGFPGPAVPVMAAVSRDPRLTDLLIGAPAGQPEFREWGRLLGSDGAAVAFLRYLPECLTALGERVEDNLRHELKTQPSFVAFEGYDTIVAIADALRLQSTGGSTANGPWEAVSIEGTRGRLRFEHTPTSGVWQCREFGIQVVDRDPVDYDRLRVLRIASDDRLEFTTSSQR